MTINGEPVERIQRHWIEVSRIPVEEPELGLSWSDVRAALEAAMADLPHREQLILRRRFYDGLTLKDIAPEIGRTRERVRQLEARAIRRLRHPRRLQCLSGVLHDRFEALLKA